MNLTADTQRDILSRLSRIEGQARGVHKMIEDGRDCAEVVQQISAMRAALAKVAAAVVTENLEDCLRRGITGDDGGQVARAKKVLLDLL